jgi:hypothetical protein
MRSVSGRKHWGVDPVEGRGSELMMLELPLTLAFKYSPIEVNGGKIDLVEMLISLTCSLTINPGLIFFLENTFLHFFQVFSSFTTQVMKIFFSYFRKK